MPSERVRTTCPTCKTRLTVDTKTGDILSHKKARPATSRSQNRRISAILRRP